MALSGNHPLFFQGVSPLCFFSNQPAADSVIILESNDPKQQFTF